MFNINTSIFKAYDIRGTYPDEINEDVIYRIGLAYAEFLEKKGGLNNRQIVIGRDMRLSSDDLFEALSQALLGQSFDVIDLGQVSSPLFYWALIDQKAAGGLMITASHNPGQYNGLKVYGEAAWPIGESSGLADIKNLALSDKPAVMSAMPGVMVKKDLLAPYLEFIKRKADFGNLKPFKIVADCGNGMMGPELAELIKNLPGQVEVMFGEPDGAFPNHEANPSKEETLAVLKAAVREKGADLGIAFDGDADRLAFVDETGESVRGDFITALVAQELLKVNPGEKIFYEVRSSRTIPEAIKSASGVPVLGRPGHTLIKAQMRQENILFGGEMSGHYFYRELGFVENSLLTMLEILKILSRENKPLSQFVAPLKKYFSSGGINFLVADADATLARVENFFSGASIKKIDGLTIEYPDWWFNLRKSNTEPLVRLNLEADTPELLEEKKKEVADLIK